MGKRFKVKEENSENLTLINYLFKFFYKNELK